MSRTDPREFGRKGVDERNEAHDQAREKLDSAIEKIYSQDGRYSNQLEKDLDGLRQDIEAQQHAERTQAPTYQISGGGFNYTPNKPSHDILLPDDLRKLEAEEIAKHPGVRALNAKLRTEGLQAAIGSTRVFNDGAYDNTRDETAYAPCIRVTALDK